MTLVPGAQLGPYEILGAIGAGGMGEVHRAKDTKLNRDVAIKVLPAAFAQEPMWSPTGTELFFRKGRDLLAVAVQTTPTFSAGRPRVLFSGDYPPGPLLANYDVSPDGRRFLIIRGRQWLEGQLVVLNWFAEWKQLGTGGR